LSIAALAGMAIFSTPAYAETDVQIDLSQNPITSATLDYLKENNILIPQKEFEKDADGKFVLDDNGFPVMKDGTPLVSPGSAYTISEGTEADHSFEYITEDEEGNLTTSYYKIGLKSSPLMGEDTGEGGIQGANHVTWTKVNAPAEGADLPANTISVKLPNDVTKYYQYIYTKPSNYTTETKVKDLGTITDFVGGTSREHAKIVVDSVINNAEGSPISIENKLFEHNKSTVILKPSSGYKYVDILGGVVYNAGDIDKITADFIGNSLSIGERGSISSYAYGGAIANVGTIGDITGDFISNNFTVNEVGATYGGAIYNGKGVIDNISGDFIGNSATYWGGAILNIQGTIGSIKSNFLNNTANNGGAVDNRGTIGSIAGNFIGNSADYAGAIDNGGEAYKWGTIESITGNFIGNSAKYSSGAINNSSGSIGSITGDFIGNSAGSSGGAIYNTDNRFFGTGIIGNITGDFIGNSAERYGGAIYNFGGVIGGITGNFINNSVVGNSASGGAIYNIADSNCVRDLGTIGNITGNFINNSVSGNSSSGGAIYNENAPIGIITGNFIGNSVNAESGDVAGGAIFNQVKLWDYLGDLSYYVDGGIVNSSFIGNYAKSEDGTAKGGAIYTKNKPIDIISKDGYTTVFKGNYTEANGVRVDNAIYVDNDFKNKKSTNLNFILQNSGKVLMADSIDGYVPPSLEAFLAKENATSIEELAQKDRFKETAVDTYLYRYGSGATTFDEFAQRSGYKETALDTFMYRYHVNTFEEFAQRNGFRGTAVETFLSRNGSGATTFDEYAQKQGFANTEAFLATKGYSTVEEFLEKSSNLKGNSASEQFLWATGKCETVEEWLANYAGLKGNTATEQYIWASGKYESLEKYLEEKYDLKGDSPIAQYIWYNGRCLTLEEFLGQYYTVNITGDSKENTVFYMLNDMYNANVNIANTTINTINNSPHVYNFNSLTIKGDTNFVADVDLLNQEMDRFTAKNYGEHNGNLNVVGINILSDAPAERDITAVYFAQPGLKNNVTNGLGEVPQSQYQNIEVFTPIYKYNVTYDKENQYDGKGDGGYFLFTKGDKHITPGGGTGSTGNPSDAFNPAVLTAPVSSVAASQATINETFKYVFEHADAFTQMPQMERMSKIEANKYALSTDYNQNLGSFDYDKQNKAAWVRPYTTFESMNLKNGPKVDAITYGTLIGHDGDFKEMKHGWHRIGTSYIGYNGSQLDYAGNDTTMNGGLLGMTETFYKGNFWTALTASAGASVGETNTMYGKEDFTSLIAGIGSKTGYNFEFKEGKLIVQPIMFMSYTFVNTFDYTNAAGVSIDTKPAHSLQLTPSIRVISNLKNGWQPYASVGMVWNLMNESNVTANGVKLPEMSMKPYVEYGLGVQRNWKDKFTAFGQAMVRNGGRNGVALTAGFRWAIGRDTEKHNHEQVYRPAKKVMRKASL